VAASFLRCDERNPVRFRRSFARVNGGCGLVGNGGNGANGDARPVASVSSSTSSTSLGGVGLRGVGLSSSSPVSLPSFFFACFFAFFFACFCFFDFFFV